MPCLNIKESNADFLRTNYEFSLNLSIKIAFFHCKSSINVCYMPFVKLFMNVLCSLSLSLGVIFSVPFLSVLRGHSFFHFRHNGQWPPTSKDFLSQILSITFFPSLIIESQYFPFLMLSAKQGNYWYHFITSLVWRGPWLGIESGIIALDASTLPTRLSRRRWMG